jgi:hypothetical protein
MNIIITMTNFFSLNDIWKGLGITDFSFLAFLKIIFLIFFILVNITLFYFEFLENENKSQSDLIYYKENGFGATSKKILSGFVVVAGGYSSYLTIRDEYRNKKYLDEVRAEMIQKSEACDKDIKSALDRETAQALSHRLHLDRMHRAFIDSTNAEYMKKSLEESIKNYKARLANGDTSVTPQIIQTKEYELADWSRQVIIAKNELKISIDNGLKYSDEVLKETDESKILAKINKDKDKDNDNTTDNDSGGFTAYSIESIGTNFEVLNGISKLAYVMIFSSSIIFWCLLSIILNIYGNYLIERFNLEAKYPKLALFISYRKKISKYYLITNFLLIISMCLVNVILGVAILSL